MAGGWFIGNRHSNARTYGQLTASSRGTSIPGSASINTKGAYTQLTASTVGDAAAIIVNVSNWVTTGISNAVDIAVGAGGSEQVIISNILESTNYNTTLTALFPIQIPNGTRIAARSQGIVGSDNPAVSVTLLDDGMIGRSGSVIDTIGFTSASTFGTSVDPGGTANTKGSYSQIIASTAADYCGFCFILDTLARTAAGTSNVQLMDVAVGAGGSEKIIVPDYAIMVNTGNGVQPIVSPWYEMDIIAGTRIAVRSQCSITTAGSRTFGFTMYGMRV